MTACAMIAGMVPMALALGEGGEQTAPLGRAVIGGLAAATFATLVILPSGVALVPGRGSTRPPCLRPPDPPSRYFDREARSAQRGAHSAVRSVLCVLTGAALLATNAGCYPSSKGPPEAPPASAGHQSGSSIAVIKPERTTLRRRVRQPGYI